MIQKLKALLTNVGIASVLLAPTLVPATVYAQPSIEGSLCGGAQDFKFETGSQSKSKCADPEAETRVNSLITTVINIFSVIVGIVAVIMIVYGGFKYITSGGDSGNITGAKNTILFAIVGLIIVALAQIIVRFVLYRAVSGSE